MRSLVDVPAARAVEVVALSEVVRSTKRIVAGAAAFQRAAKAETSAASASVGPPLIARVFESDGDEMEQYAGEIVAALADVRRQLADLDNLDDRVAVCVPDGAFRAALERPLAKALGDGFELVDAAAASAALPQEEPGEALGPQRLVLDAIDAIDGLERLIVICVGLDAAVAQDAAATRSRLYRARISVYVFSRRPEE